MSLMFPRIELTNRNSQKTLQQQLFSDKNEDNTNQNFNQKLMKGNYSYQEDYSSTTIQNSPTKGGEISTPDRSVKGSLDRVKYSPKQSSKGQLNNEDKRALANFQYQQEGNLDRVWRFKFFGILGQLAKFMRCVRMTSLLYFRPENFLSRDHFEIINDAAYEFKNGEDKSTFFDESWSRDKLAIIRMEKQQLGSFQQQIRKAYRSGYIYPLVFQIKQVIWFQDNLIHIYFVDLLIYFFNFYFLEFCRWSKKNIQSILNPIFTKLENVHAPQGALRIWDICLTGVLLIEVLILSLHITYSTFLQSQFAYIQIPLIGAISLDILFSFFKGYQEKGVLELSTRACFAHYFETGFLLDTASLLCYIVGLQFDLYYLAIIFIWRSTDRYYDQLYLVIDALQLNERFGNEKVKLLELVFTIFLLGHIFSCIWYWIGTYTLEHYKGHPDTQSWIEYYNLQGKNWEKQYVSSLFWVFTTMTTIGFGDIVPQNLEERLVAIVIMMLSCFVFAYSVNSIGVLLNDINKKQIFHRQRLKSMNAYMETKKISHGLQSKIRCYLDYINKEEQNGKNQNEGVAVSILSKSLKEQLLREVNYNVLLKMKIFKSTNLPFSDLFLNQLSLCVTEKTYMPDDIISNNQEESSIHYIASGEAKLVIKEASLSKPKIVLQNLKTGQSFGQFGFISQELVKGWSIASHVTTINSLKYSDFLKVIQQFPEDFEKFCMLREELMFEQNFDQLNITCTFCSSGNHQEVDCRLINFRPSKGKLVIIADRSKPVSRIKGFNRRNIQKPNSLTIQSIIYEQALDFQEDKGLISDASLEFQEDDRQNDEDLARIQMEQQQQQQLQYNTRSKNKQSDNLNGISSSSGQQNKNKRGSENQQIFNRKSGRKLSEIEFNNIRQQNQRTTLKRGSVLLQSNLGQDFGLAAQKKSIMKQTFMNPDKKIALDLIFPQDDNDKGEQQKSYQLIEEINEDDYTPNRYKSISNLTDLQFSNFNKINNKFQHLNNLKPPEKDIQDDTVSDMSEEQNLDNNIQKRKQFKEHYETLSEKSLCINPEMRAEFQFFWKIKGDEIEVDKIQQFETYRIDQNYSNVIEAYNESVEINRQRILKLNERKNKRRTHKTTLFIPHGRATSNQMIESKF